MKSLSRIVLGWGVLASLASASSLARAEPPAQPNAAPAPTAPPDLVLLKNGGMLRGTISELTPGQQVTIVLLTGETRKVPMSDVTYAGPASKAPGAAPAPPSPTPPDSDAARPTITVKANEVPIKFVSSEPKLTLHLKTHSAVLARTSGRVAVRGYDRICTSPCEASLPSGTHEFGVSPEGGDPVEVDKSVTLESASKLEAKYESKSGVRTIGWVLAIGGSIGGTILILTASGSEENCSSGSCIDMPQVNTDQLYAGLGIAGAGLIIGGALILFSTDSAELKLTPLAPAAPPASPTAAIKGDAASKLGPWAGVQGLALSGRF
jgi:hypothetical protein